MRPEEIKTPITDMVGGGVHDTAIGEWTDDGAMAAAVADAYITKKRFDPAEIALNFMTWRKSGFFGTRNYVFDCGRTVSESIKDMTPSNPYRGSTDPSSSGNGSIMRIAPIVLANHNSVTQSVAQSVAVSLMTHGNSDTIEYITGFVAELHSGKKLDEFDYLRNYSLRQSYGHGSIMHAYNMAWHCVDESFSFESALVMAVNKGHDADTVGAVTGMLAGRKYGYKNIPRRWLDKLMKRDQLVSMAEQLYKLGGTDES
jgi:ADP-ribosyl-[dinitrogen reductase] hydrolase